MSCVRARRVLRSCPGWVEDDAVVGPDDPLDDPWLRGPGDFIRRMSGPVRILLDTWVLIDLGGVAFGGDESAVPAVSAVSVAELVYGLDPDDSIERRARTERYRAVLDEFDVLAFDTRAAESYDTMAAVVRRAGRNPRPRRIDLLIAAVSANAMPMLTRKLEGFRRPAAAGRGPRSMTKSTVRRRR